MVSTQGGQESQLINYTKLVRTIPEVIPNDEELWGNYLRKYG